MGKILTVTLNPCIDKTITVDGFVYGGLNRVRSMRTDAGGKGINASKVLKSFGADVLCYTLAAGDGAGFIKNYLAEKEIESKFGKASGEVRTNLKIVDTHSGVTTEVNEKGISLSEMECEDAVSEIEALLSDAEILVLAGSLPAGMDADTYGKLIKIAKGKGTRVILDADGERLKQGLSEIPYAMKPNISEFEELCGEKLDSQEKIVLNARKWIEKGVGIVVVSMGGDGAIFVSKDESYKTLPLDIECKSTVGAGDSMVATLAYGLQKGYSLEKISQLCTCAGSITCSKEGTQVCTYNEVMENLEKVKVLKID